MDKESSATGKKVAMREAAIAALQQKGFEVKNRASGSGSPPFSQVDITKGGKTLRCSLKLTTRSQGRIHYLREGDDWKVLRQVDRVLHVWHHPNEPSSLRLSMFKAETVKAAFDKNYAAAVKGGFANIPAWISPRYESAPRFAGSGFEGEAEWTETVPFGSPGTAPRDRPAASPERSSPSSPVEEGGAGIMDRIKAMLAEHMGVPAERIEVDVRVKL